MHLANEGTPSPMSLGAAPRTSGVQERLSKGLCGMVSVGGAHRLSGPTGGVEEEVGQVGQILVCLF